jgi:hypothetical protein
MSFVVFTYGKQEHIYVQANSKTKKALDKVLSYCRSAGEDINDFLAPIIEEAGKKALKELEASKKAAAEAMSGVEAF